METTFYYWRTTFQLDDVEKNAITKSRSQKLYTRFFDVDVEDNRKPFPVSEIQFLEQTKMEIIPVVFIKNKTFELLKNDEIQSLAQNIVNKIFAIAKKNNISISEIQMDCDWNGTSKISYFKFLETTKAILMRRSIQLSATIRLHQVKYKEKTGVPPVDKGMLMVYNVAKLDALDTKNSIFDRALILDYLDKLSSYPLHLDVAMPIFMQNIIFRNGKMVGLFRKREFSKDQDLKYFEKERDDYICIQDTTMLQFSIKKGDFIRVETLNDNDWEHVIKFISKHIQNDKYTLVLFDLSSSNIQNFDYENIIREIN
jgi:hypothetical protein